MQKDMHQGSYPPSLQSVPKQPRPYGLVYSNSGSQAPMKTYAVDNDGNTYYSKRHSPSSVNSQGSYQVRKVVDGGMPEATYVKYDNGTRFVQM